MKILIMLGSPDRYTSALRYIKTYIPDGLTTPKDIFDYHKRDVGQARCGVRLLELDSDTNSITVLYEHSVEPKKKIVINASKVTTQPTVASYATVAATAQDTLFNMTMA